MDKFIVIFNHYAIWVCGIIYLIIEVLDYYYSFKINRHYLKLRRSIGRQKQAVDRVRHSANMQYLKGEINEFIHESVINQANLIEDNLKRIDKKHKNSYHKTYVKGFKYFHKLVDWIEER